jgi:peptide/nickel transport system substrate-binding protein
VAAAQTRAETLRQVTGNNINTLDLTLPGATRESFGIGMQLYDRLVAFGRKPVAGGFIYDATAIRGELAESYTVSPDGMKFTFTIRRDAKWHDGTPVTAADVKWSLDRHVTANSLAKSQLQITSWTSPDQFRVIDERTVEAVLPRPDRRGLMNLCVPYAS